MGKPYIVCADDDAEVLASIERDLRKRYASKYRILRAESGHAALDVLREVSERKDPVALFLVDQRMPGMTGVELLEKSIEFYPEAKRVLLTAYSDTDAAVKAINAAKVSHYLTKPWDPPEVCLYPILDDLMRDWELGYRPGFEGPRVVGLRFSPETHEIKNFLGRNQIPYKWIDAADAAATEPELKEAKAEHAELPVVIFADHTFLSKPSQMDVATKLGLHTQPTAPFYDFAIIGGGPAGLAAAVYGASEGLNTVLVEREAPGGQAGLSSRIENYLGFPAGLSGADLARRALDQAQKFGVEIVTAQDARELCLRANYKVVTLADGSEISCRALLIASGVQYRKLEAEGVDRLNGAGIYYGAAVSEAISCKDETVFIVGGANSAGQAAVFLSQYAAKIVILVRGKGLASTMSKYLIDQIEKTPNIEVWPCRNVVKAEGADHLTAITIRDTDSGKEQTCPTSSLFVFIGAVPTTDWIGDFLSRDDRGFLLTGPDVMNGSKSPEGWTEDRAPYLLETNVPGIFAAGDVRHGSVKRVASGVGEGSISVQFVHRYLGEPSA